MAKKSAIYTRTGDLGETGLFGGTRVRKNSLRIQAIGSIDELNALLGLTISQAKESKIRKFIEEIQNQLFEIGAELANPKTNTFGRVRNNQIEKIEEFIDTLDSKLKPLKNFILPGGSFVASLLHYSRTVCRKAERNVVGLSEKESVDPLIKQYLNRLSDFLFVAARSINQKQGKKEIIWKK